MQTTPTIQQLRHCISIQRANTQISRNRWPLDFSIYNFGDLCNLLWDSTVLEIEKRGGKPNATEEIRDKISKIAQWLQNPPRQGLMLYGSYGSGKTTLIQAVCSVIELIGRDANPKIAVARWTAVDLTALAKGTLKHRDADLNKIKTAKILLIDDLGIEPLEIKDYGNIQTPIVDILDYRYIHQLPTFITTNQDDETTTCKYGKRILDRLNEMCSRLGFTAESFR